MGDYRKGFIAGYKEAIKELKDCLKKNKYSGLSRRGR